jgi:hypothetical protein
MGTLQNIILWETLQDIVSIGEAGECCEHISSGCMFFHTYVFIYIFLVKKKYNYKGKRYNHLGRANTKPRGLKKQCPFGA